MQNARPEHLEKYLVSFLAPPYPIGMTTSEFFGSWPQRFPQVVTTGVTIDPQLFSPNFSLPLKHFAEPDEAKELRLSAWNALIRSDKEKHPDWISGEMNGLPALYVVENGKTKPVRYANALYTQDDPTSPSCFYDTDWTYFNVANIPEYFNRLKDAGVQPPLMAGIHLESPRIPLVKRPSTKMGRPDELHPPSCAMRAPSHFYSASQFLLPKYLGQLGFESPEVALQNCAIVIRQIHAYNPDHQPERPHLSDYCLQFEGGIGQLEP